MSAWRNISLFDLIKIPGYTDEKRDHFLTLLGCDVSKGVEVLECTHRTLSNEVVTGTFFICKELTTKEWLTNNPLSSIEAVYASTNDRSLREELSGMNRRAGYMQKWEKEE